MPVRSNEHQEAGRLGGQFPSRCQIQQGQRLRVAWERQGCCLSGLHPMPVHQAWAHQRIFRQAFMQKMCEDALGPNPKVLRTLPSDWTVNEAELPHGCGTGQDKGSSAHGLTKRWRTIEVAPGFCLLGAGSSSWFRFPVLVSCDGFLNSAAASACSKATAKPERGRALDLVGQ